MVPLPAAARLDTFAFNRRPPLEKDGFPEPRAPSQQTDVFESPSMAPYRIPTNRDVILENFGNSRRSGAEVLELSEEIRVDVCAADPLIVTVLRLSSR